MSEKTEQPTPKKLRDARKKGQVAKSKEIATCAVIVGLFAYFYFFFGHYMQRLKYLVGSPAKYFHQPFDQALINMAKTGFQEFALLTLPFALTAMLIAVLSYLLQFGFLVSFEQIKPDLNKVNPVQGVKKIVSLSNLMELVKSIVKILLLAAILYLIIKDNVKNLLHLHQGSSQQAALDLLCEILKRLAVAVSALFIILAIIDHFVQKYLHIKKLKMSKDEIKREYKDREGDPHLKGRRRQLQIEISQDDMAAKIKEATVVLTQSKKKAVVLRYKMGETPLPIVSVKGKNILTEKIVTMAKKHGIPVFADAALTRDLYEDCEEGNYITSDLIEPVATVLRKVMGIDGQKNPDAA